MLVSRQSDAEPQPAAPAPLSGPKARTGRLMRETAMRLMQAGATPSVSEVAEAAGVSRATAYRYFPSQAALVGAVVDQALGPMLDWSSPSADPAVRVAELVRAGLPRIDAFEATFKAALKLSLEQWARDRAGTLGQETQFKRGHRIELLREALAPLQGRISQSGFDRLAQALSLIFGVEILTVLKDIWGLDGQETQSVAEWAANALLRAALEEDGPSRSP